MFLAILLPYRLVSFTLHPTKEKEQIPVNDVNLSTYNHETVEWENIKASLKKIIWPDVLAKYKSTEEKFKIIIDIVIKIVEKNCNIFEIRGGTHSNNIPRDRRILLKRKNYIKNYEIQTQQTQKMS